MSKRAVKTVETTDQDGYKVVFEDSKDPEGWGPFFTKQNMGDVQPGMELEFNWEKRGGRNGPFFIFKGDVQIGGFSAPQPGKQYSAPQRQASAPTSNMDQSQHIFITGIVGRAMGSGNFALTDIKALTLAARDAYNALSAPAGLPDDEIGF